MELFKVFVDAVCSIAAELKAHNALYRQELLGKTQETLQRVEAAAPPADEIEERAEIIKQLTELGEKVHGKTSTPNLKKKLDELLAARKADGPSKAAAVVAPPDPFADPSEAQTVTVTKEDLRAALKACSRSKGEYDPKNPEAPGNVRAMAALDLMQKIAGTQKISDVKPELYAELLAQANALAAS